MCIVDLGSLKKLWGLKRTATWKRQSIISCVFIGIEVYYAGEFAGIPPGRATIRCLILCWTGDYPAQCEVGKFIFNGVHPCRRDKLKGVRVTRNTATLTFILRYATLFRHKSRGYKAILLWGLPLPGILSLAKEGATQCT